MKKLVILVLLVIAAWQAHAHWNDLVDRKPRHEVVVKNDGDRIIERLRVTVGRQTFVKERLGPREQAVFRFQVGSDAAFTLVWQWSDKTDETRWNGGMVAAGPMVQRHYIEVNDDASVVYHAEPLATP